MAPSVAGIASATNSGSAKKAVAVEAAAESGTAVEAGGATAGNGTSAGTSAGADAEPPIPPATWPTSLPPPQSQHVVSIMMGNSSWNWALHDGSDHDYMPTMFWGNSILAVEEKNMTLARVIPAQFHQILFGSVNFTTKSAASYRLSLRLPPLPVYIVSTNDENEPLLKSLFAGIPAMLYKLQASDLMPLLNQKAGADTTTTTTTTHYQGMGVDRLLNYTAARSLYPQASSILVLDGGTAMTYTTLVPTDKAGATTEAAKNATNGTTPLTPSNNATVTAGANMSSSTPSTYTFAGAIGAGLKLKMQGLHDYTDDLPLVEPDHLLELMDLASTNKMPFTIFPEINVPIAPPTSAAVTTTATMTKEERMESVSRSLVGSLLIETALSLCQMVRGWLNTQSKTNGTASSAGTGTTAANSLTPAAWDKLPIVVVTGGDGNVYKRLLEPKHAHICQTDAANLRLLESGISIASAAKDALGVKPVTVTAAELRTASENADRGSSISSGNNINSKTVPKAFRLQEHRYLPHTGVQRVLLQNQLSPTDSNSKTEMIRNQMIGQRVVVRDGNRKKAYGTIMEVQRGTELDGDYFSVVYDVNGSVDDLNSVELYEGLGLYIESGAKPDKSNSDDGLHNIRVLNKLKDAQEARVLLKENSEAVQQMLEPSPPPRATRAVAAPRAVEDAAAPAKPSNEQQETPSSSTDAPPKKKLKATPREPSSYKGERVAKYFVMEGKNILFFGTVGEYVTDDGENWWDINYDDDDSEGVTIEELKKLLKTYSKKQHLDPNKETAKSKEAS